MSVTHFSRAYCEHFNHTLQFPESDSLIAESPILYSKWVQGMRSTTRTLQIARHPTHHHQVEHQAGPTTPWASCGALITVTAEESTSAAHTQPRHHRIQCIHSRHVSIVFYGTPAVSKDTDRAHHRHRTLGSSLTTFVFSERYARSLRPIVPIHSKIRSRGLRAI